MSQFTTPLELEFIDGRTWKVTEPFVYDVGALGSWETISVPAGFVTDFASIPRGLWNLLPPTGLYAKAAVLHDYLYRGGTTMYFDHDKPVTRARADAIFYEAMGVLGVMWWSKWLVYAGVRLGGWPTWHHYHKGA